MLVQRGLMLPVGMEQLVVRSAVRRRDFDTLVGYKVVLVAVIDNVVNMVLEKYFYLINCLPVMAAFVPHIFMGP